MGRLGAYKILSNKMDFRIIASYILFIFQVTSSIDTSLGNLSSQEKKTIDAIVQAR